MLHCMLDAMQRTRVPFRCTPGTHHFFCMGSRKALGSLHQGRKGERACTSKASGANMGRSGIAWVARTEN